MKRVFCILPALAGLASAQDKPVLSPPRAPGAAANLELTVYLVSGLAQAQAAARDEVPQDQDFLFNLYASTRAQEMALTPWDAAQTESFLRSQFHLQAAHYHRHYPEAAFLVIQDGGQPIGRLYIDRQPGEIHILDIALAPERRGAGIGTAFWQPRVSLMLYGLTALIWLIPDRRIEKVVKAEIGN